jgi:hypothetical protein
MSFISSPPFSSQNMPCSILTGNKGLVRLGCALGSGVVGILVVEDHRGGDDDSASGTNNICFTFCLTLSDLIETISSCYVDDNFLVQEPKLTDLACY